MELTELGGSSALRYGQRVLPSSLWIERGGTGGGRGGAAAAAADGSIRIPHEAGRGLLTHRTLDPLPSFGITTRPPSSLSSSSSTTTTPSYSPLDSTHVVFGRIIPTKSSIEFLNRAVDLPTYSTDRPAVSPVVVNSNAGDGGSGGGAVVGSEQRAAEEAAGKIFRLQREFFRGAAKTLGDDRLDKVYEGRILRRVEVTASGLL